MKKCQFTIQTVSPLHKQHDSLRYLNILGPLVGCLGLKSFMHNDHLGLPGGNGGPFCNRWLPVQQAWDRMVQVVFHFLPCSHLPLLPFSSCMHPEEGKRPVFTRAGWHCHKQAQSWRWRWRSHIGQSRSPVPCNHMETQHPPLRAPQFPGTGSCATHKQRRQESLRKIVEEDQAAHLPLAIPNCRGSSEISSGSQRKGEGDWDQQAKLCHYESVFSLQPLFVEFPSWDSGLADIW